MLYDEVVRLFDFAQSDVKRVGTGIQQIDDLIRGPAPGEICMILGRSYSGKSLVGQNIIAAHPTTPSIFFSLEMPSMQALIRLYAMWSDTPAGEVQESIERGEPNPDIFDIVEAFPKHEIVDTPGMTLHEMSIALDEFETRKGCRPDFVVVDYLELLGGAKASGEGYLATERQSTMLKDWAKEEAMRVFVLHQTNRLEPQWKPPTEDSARNAGFTEADFVIGLWRPHKDPRLNYIDKLRYQHTMSVNVLKNRPFFKEADKIDLTIEPSLRIWRPKDQRFQSAAVRSEQQQSDHPDPFTG